MDLFSLLRLERTIRVIGFDDAPFQVQGEDPAVIASVIERLSERGHVPEALRLAHLSTAAVLTGESGNQA